MEAAVAIVPALLLIAWAGLEPQSQLATPMQLIVERTDFSEPFAPGEPPLGLTITLFNPGPKVVHGWALQTMTTFGDGYTSHGGTASDGHAYPVREDGRGGPIPVGGRRLVRSGFSSRAGTAGLPVSIGARVIAVIFEDDTALGDEREIRWLFARRAANQRTWPRVEKIVAAARADGGDARTVLERIAAAFEGITDEDFQWTAAHSVGRTLRLNLKHTKDPAALLKHLLADIREKRAATEAHWQRRY
jgi:hypothetical protein